MNRYKFQQNFSFGKLHPLEVAGNRIEWVYVVFLFDKFHKIQQVTIWMTSTQYMHPNTGSSCQFFSV